MFKTTISIFPKSCAVTRAGSRIWVWRGQVEIRRRKDRGAEGAECIWGGVWGEPPHQNFFSFLGLKMRMMVRSPVHLECLFLQCNRSRSRPALRLPTLTFQADCGSIKGAGVSAEESTEHYLSW